MIILLKNWYGELQKTATRYRIVRKGDGCVFCYCNTLKEASKIFTRLGNRNK